MHLEAETDVRGPDRTQVNGKCRSQSAESRLRPNQVPGCSEARGNEDGDKMSGLSDLRNRAGHAGPPSELDFTLHVVSLSLTIFIIKIFDGRYLFSHKRF